MRLADMLARAAAVLLALAVACELVPYVRREAWLRGYDDASADFFGWEEE